jgi:hypothetical protein
MPGLVARYGFRRAVETGTGHGTSAKHMASLGLDVHTIDIDPRATVDIPGVTFHLGDSPDVLQKLVGDPVPTFWWLDAHYPGEFFKEPIDSEPDLAKRLPIFRELDVLQAGRDMSRDVIGIDDLKIFVEGTYQEGNQPEHLMVQNGHRIFERLSRTHWTMTSGKNQGYLLAVPCDRSYLP